MNAIRNMFIRLMIALLFVFPFAYSSFTVFAQENVGNEVEQNDSINIKTNLEDEITTKVDKYTFDVWVRDKDDKKIDTKYITVTNNGKDVPINWDDDEKTSYTVDLEVGENKIIVLVDYEDEKVSDTYTIYREEAADGDVIGTVVFSVDAFTVGLGYIIEPVEVDLIKGERASELLVRTLEEHGYKYQHTGTLESAFYLSYIYEDESVIYKTEPKIPEVLKEELKGNFDESNYFPDSLGEFDFNSLSGWMYSVNNVFPNVGYADYYLKDNDVMRTQFTLALGSDIGGGWDRNFFELVNKDELTRKVAEINTHHRDEYLKDNDVEKAYNKSLDILQKVNATQTEIDNALNDLNEAIDKYTDKNIAQSVVQAINELPAKDDLTLEDAEDVASVRAAYSALTKEQQKLVNNIDQLEVLEEYLEVLEKEQADKEAAEAVFTMIEDLPTVSDITLEDAEDVASVRAAYDGLTSTQQGLVSNLHKLEALEEELKKLQEAADKEQADKEAAEAVFTMIEDLPTVSDITLEDAEAVVSARAAYEGLTTTQQKLVTNLNKLKELESQLVMLEKERKANDVIKQIENLPTVEQLTLEDEEHILSARAAYDGLSEDEKNIVDNIEQLKLLEEQLIILKEKEEAEIAKEVVRIIERLPTVENITLDDVEDVSFARLEYEALTKEQQALVSNLDKLEALEEQLSVLEKEEFDQKAAKDVIELIDSLPSLEQLTLEDASKVLFARDAFDILTKDQQLLVTNIETLESLEEKLKKLKEDSNSTDQMDEESNKKNDDSIDKELEEEESEHNEKKRPDDEKMNEMGANEKNDANKQNKKKEDRLTKLRNKEPGQLGKNKADNDLNKPGMQVDSSKEKQTLPNTASPMYLWMFVGTIFVLIGFVYFVFQYRIRKNDM